MTNYTNQQVFDFLERIKSHLYRLDYRDLSMTMDRYIPRVPLSIAEYDTFPQGNKGLTTNFLYRARQNRNDLPNSTMLAPWQSISEVSLIPPEKRHFIKTGRANLPGVARFYCSTEPHIACNEAISKGFPLKSLSNQTYVTVTSWKVKESLLLAQVLYAEAGLKYFQQFDQEIYRKKLEFLSLEKEQFYPVIRKMCSSDEEYELSIRLLEYFSDQFGKLEVSNGFDYHLSNYYCDHIFDRTSDNPVDGILYPSVPFSYQGFNIVLHERAIHKLEFSQAMFYWVVHHYSPPPGKTQYIPLEQVGGENGTDKIGWRQFKLNE